jgi:gamma-glutamyltranspeptidase/glutathione hydrolase
VVALNGSGRAGALATPEFFRAAGQDRIPSRGALSVTVPGAVGAWAEALAKHGTISLASALEPAIRYAEGGFPVTQRLHDDIAESAEVLNDVAKSLYLKDSVPPAPGTLLRNPALARTLRRIAQDGPSVLYGGPVGEHIATFLTQQGGHLRAPDFAAHQTTWEQPIETDYLGLRVLALPPNTQGVTLLQQMRMAGALTELTSLTHNSADYLQRMIEIKRLAFADRDRWVADPAFVAVPVARMLDPNYAAERVATIVPGKATDSIASGITGASEPAERAAPDNGDTVYLTAVDAEGNAVSWIQSLFSSFGSGLMEPETGVVLHNRGALYTLDAAHPQIVAPGKRPFHTLTPHMALDGNRLAFTFGTPGGDGQTQTLMQVVNNLLRFRMSPQAAVEAPRFRSEAGSEILLEDRIPQEAQRALAAMGYEVRTVGGWTATFGGAQMIRIHPESGARMVASDPRREAYGIAY